MGVDNFVRVNLACPKMIKTVLIISAVIACISADVFTATKTFTGKDKKGKNKKTITCEIEIDYSGDSADKAGTSVDCSVNNENKNKDEIKSITKTFTFRWRCFIRTSHLALPCRGHSNLWDRCIRLYR